MPKPTICLNMIVKNEGHIIVETLISICPYIDDYIINDTGSTDNTIEVITDFFKRRGIPGQIFKNEFREFDYARTTALELCSHSKSKYIWVIDADDLVKGVPKFPDNMNADSYYLQYGNNFMYMRCQIFKNDPSLGWHYVGWVHEYPASKKGNISEEILEGCSIESRRLGDRSKNPNKYLHDAYKLEKSYELKPNTRDLFYCANSYFDHVNSHCDDATYINNDKKFLLMAAQKYNKRIEEKDFPEEVFYSYLRLAETLEKLDFPWQKVEDKYIEAYEYYKIRGPEAIYIIMMHYYDEKNWHKAYEYGKMVIHTPFPKQCRLFIHKKIYTYLLPLNYLVIASNYKKYLEAYLIAKKLSTEISNEKDANKNLVNHNLSYLINCDKNITQNCLLYVGNRAVNNQFYEILQILNMCYNVYLIGTLIDITQIKSKTVYLTDLETVKKNKASLCIKKVYLYDNLNLIENLGNFSASNITLIQLSNEFSLVYKNNISVCIRNKLYLEQLLKNVSCILTNNMNMINIIENRQDLFDLSIINDIIKVCEEKNNKKYIIKEYPNNKMNGVELYMPSYFNNMNNHEKFNYIRSIMDECKRPELNIYWANLMESTGSHIVALQYIDKALAVENNPIFNMYRAKYLYNLGKYEESYKLAVQNYPKLNVNDDDYIFFEDIKDKNIDFVKDYFLAYPANIIQNIKSKILSQVKTIFTMTSCKRYDLFHKTMNSFINCCEDIHLIDYWICIDDNSSEQDRLLMKKNYPFINYIFKNIDDKGHIKSMNIIHDIIVQNSNIENVLHMEDDFHFVCRKKYINEALEILKDTEVKQVLFNRNYMEIENYKNRLPGGFPKKINNIRYIVHEHYERGTKEYTEAEGKYKDKGGLQLYWPHFSFRPSIVPASVYRNIGIFCNVPHFEMQYAREFVNLGYKSAFFDNFSCIHIGKKTWEQTPNSYTLNNVDQFTNSKHNISIKLVNYDKSPINTKLKNILNTNNIQYEILYPSPVQITDKIIELFKDNDFNYMNNIISNMFLHKYILESLDNDNDYCIVLNNKINFEKEFSLNEIINYIKTNNIELLNLTNNNNSRIFGAYVISKKLARSIEYINIKHSIFDDIKYENYVICNYSEIEELNYEKLDGYEFLSQLDYYGNDIRYIGKMPYSEMKKICDKEPDCVGFNTNGYIKCKNETLCKLYLSTDVTQGFYKKIET